MIFKTQDVEFFLTIQDFRICLTMTVLKTKKLEFVNHFGFCVSVRSKSE